MGTRTPWGTADSVREIAPGIKFYSTPSHGGVKLDRKRQAIVPEYMRQEGGWYEEDLDWAIPALVFPEAFPDKKEQENAEHTLRNWRPEVWERFFGRELKPGESHKRDEAVCLEEHRNDYIGVAAWGDWYQGVPDGHVLVAAVRGGRDMKTGAYRGEEAYFLMPAEEYSGRSPCGFLIDESRHQRVNKADFGPGMKKKASLSGASTDWKREALEKFLRSYLEAAVWSSTDEAGQPLDRDHSESDIDEASIKAARKDAEKFLRANWDSLVQTDGDWSQHGHDFWLSRNGHGAGFFDRGYGEVGDRLQEAARAFGEKLLYVGDDGSLYFS